MLRGELFCPVFTHFCCTRFDLGNVVKNVQDENGYKMASKCIVIGGG